MRSGLSELSCNATLFQGFSQKCLVSISLQLTPYLNNHTGISCLEGNLVPVGICKRFMGKIVEEGGEWLRNRCTCLQDKVSLFSLWLCNLSFFLFCLHKWHFFTGSTVSSAKALCCISADSTAMELLPFIFWDNPPPPFFVHTAPTLPTCTLKTQSRILYGQQDLQVQMPFVQQAGKSNSLLLESSHSGPNTGVGVEGGEEELIPVVTFLFSLISLSLARSWGKNFPTLSFNLLIWFCCCWFALWLHPSLFYCNPPHVKLTWL